MNTTDYQLTAYDASTTVINTTTQLDSTPGWINLYFPYSSGAIGSTALVANATLPNGSNVGDQIFIAAYLNTPYETINVYMPSSLGSLTFSSSSNYRYLLVWSGTIWNAFAAIF